MTEFARAYVTKWDIQAETVVEVGSRVPSDGNAEVQRHKGTSA